MKPNTSPVKIQANRENALRSTGPKTLEGKQSVRWNALKHGLLSKEVVIPTGDGKERKADFQAVLKALQEELQPAGILEEILVEKIAVCYWRLRRALRFEVGQVRENLDTFSFDTVLNRYEAMSSLWSPKERHLVRTTVGVQKLVGRLAEVRNHVEKDGGELCETCKEVLLEWFSDEDNDWGEAVAFFCWVMSGGPEKSPEEFVGGARPSPDECKRYVLELLDEKQEALSIAMRAASAREALHDASEKARLSLPEPEAMDRLLRYETSIERQLYRAINQLERLQRRRQGEAIPPPINVELAGDN